mgnify:CR=1 FL=1
MKASILIVSMLLANALNAQEVLDTIFANEHQNVAVFFPAPIRQGVVGASNFVFTYNREQGQYFGLLQAKPGNESNLLTVTRDGSVYCFILKYVDVLPKMNYFIDEDESIGNERPDMAIPKIKHTENVHDKDRKAYFERACRFLLESVRTSMATKRYKGLRLQLQHMVYDASEIYLVIEIRNNSGINFEIDYLEVYRTNGNPNKKASYQQIPLTVLYKYGMPYSIIPGHSQRFVYVLPKYVLGADEKLVMDLKELNGGRKLKLSWK